MVNWHQPRYKYNYSALILNYKQNKRKLEFTG